jgi:hypothetical protein
VTGYELVHFDFNVPPGTPQVEAIATCPAGKLAVGGGVTTTGYERDFIVQATGPANAGHGWQGNVKMESGNNITAHIYAVCVNVS